MSIRTRRRTRFELRMPSLTVDQIISSAFRAGYQRGFAAGKEAREPHPEGGV